MNERDDYVRKVTALLAKAEGTDSEPEAEAFFAKAYELMARHAIDEQALRAASAQKRASERPIKQDVMYSPDGQGAVGKRHLFSVVARSCSVEWLTYGGRNYRREGGQYARWGVAIGFRDDIEAATMLYTSLLIQVTRFAAQEWKSLNLIHNGRWKFFNGFVVGFAQRVSERLHESEQTVVADDISKALVSLRRDEVKGARAEFFPSLGLHRERSVDTLGAIYGRMAGDRADIGHSKVAASGSARLTSGG